MCADCYYFAKDSASSSASSPTYFVSDIYPSYASNSALGGNYQV